MLAREEELTAAVATAAAASAESTNGKAKSKAESDTAAAAAAAAVTAAESKAAEAAAKAEAAEKELKELQEEFTKRLNAAEKTVSHGVLLTCSLGLTPSECGPDTIIRHGGQ